MYRRKRGMQPMCRRTRLMPITKGQSFPQSRKGRDGRPVCRRASLVTGADKRFPFTIIGEPDGAAIATSRGIGGEHTFTAGGRKARNGRFILDGSPCNHYRTKPACWSRREMKLRSTLLARLHSGHSSGESPGRRAIPMFRSTSRRLGDR